MKFSKAGYTSKKLAFSTKQGPPNETDIRLVGNEVFLFKSDPDLDVSVLDKPVGKFIYDPIEKNFNYDKAYTQSIKAKVEILVKTLETKRRVEAEKKVAEAVAAQKAAPAYFVRMDEFSV